MIITKIQKPKYELIANKDEDIASFALRLYCKILDLRTEIKSGKIENLAEKNTELSQLETQYKKMEDEFNAQQKIAKQQLLKSQETKRNQTVLQKTDGIGANIPQIKPRRFMREISAIPPNDPKKIKFWDSVFAEFDCDEVKEVDLCKKIEEKYKLDFMKAHNIVLRANYEDYIEDTNAPYYVNSHIYRRKKNEITL